MTSYDDEGSIDPSCERPGCDPGRTCQIVGRIHAESDARIRIYPTDDTGLWLEIDGRDVIECIVPDDPMTPATLIVDRRSRMSLQMTVTAVDVESMMATVVSTAAARDRPGWRASPRHRSQASALRRPTAIRKVSSA